LLLVNGSPVTKWQKLNTTSSTRTGTTDGLYDWNQYAYDASLRGKYFMASSNNVDWNSGTNEVQLDLHITVEATSFTSNTFVVADATKFALIQVGQRLLYAQNDADSSAIPAGGLIVKRKEGTNKIHVCGLNGEDSAAAGELQGTITGAKDFKLYDDWIVPGMVIEHATQFPSGNGEVYIHDMKYNGGDDDNETYSAATLNAAIAGATTPGKGVSLFLKYKADDTNANPASTLAYNAGSPEKLTAVKKPYLTFGEVKMGMDHRYEIPNAALSGCKQGDVVKVVSGTEHTSFGSANNTAGTTYTLNASPDDSNVGIVDILVEQPKEFGVSLPTGTTLLSKRDILSMDDWVSGSGGTAQYAQFDSDGLKSFLFEIDSSHLTGSTYTRDFGVYFKNGGHEDIYLHSAEFVDAEYVSYIEAGDSSLFRQPGGANNVNWYVADHDATAPASSSKNFSLGSLTIQYNNVKPTEHTVDVPGPGDQRLVKLLQEDGVTVNRAPGSTNAIRCRFTCGTGSDTGGIYYGALKVKYYRDFARTKYKWDAGSTSFLERPFGDMPIFETIIPIRVALASSSSISVTDSDDTIIDSLTTINIDGLIG